MDRFDDLISKLESEFDPKGIQSGDRIEERFTHDESLGLEPILPLAVFTPSNSEDVARLLAFCDDHGVPVVARGSGTGLSGGSRPMQDCIVLSLDAMDSILELDLANSVVTVQAGVTLQQLDDYLRPFGLVYPVFPGELGSTIGGNIATNAGGMRAVKYGVTRHHVLGLEMILIDGTTITTGGKYVKSSSGYDLGQLVIGSEGTLAVVVSAQLRVYRRPEHLMTILAPIKDNDGIAHVLERLMQLEEIALGIEYVDALALVGMARRADIHLGVPTSVSDFATGYLLIMYEFFEGSSADLLAGTVSQILLDSGALDVYILDEHRAESIIKAREGAFWTAKDSGANDIIDAVVPRTSVVQLLDGVRNLASNAGAFVSGAGHIGDGNVHLSVFLAGSEERTLLISAIFGLVTSLGGEVSGEHGIGVSKVKYFVEETGVAKLNLMRRIKAAFDPKNLLNPGKMLG